MQGLKELSLTRYRFYLEAQEPSHLSAYKGSMLRGAAMHGFKRLYCGRPQGQICQLRCRMPGACEYGRIFETPAPADSYLLASQPFAPRPYVLWDRGDRWRDYRSGDVFSFELVLIGCANAALPAFTLAFQQAAAQGFGRPGRWRLARVTAVSALDGAETTVFDGRFRPLDRQVFAFGYREAQTWAESRGAVSAVQLHFVSPTRLTFRKRWIRHPEFQVLVRGLLRRLSLLSEAHGGGPWWPEDATALLEAAAQVKVVHNEVRIVGWKRRSARRGEMKLLGFTGPVWYQGNLTPFLPLLWLGQFVHVGKACVFGNGRYEIVEP